MEMVTRMCKKCFNIKELSLFGIDKRRPDGHEGVCRECRNAAKKKTKAKNVGNVVKTSGVNCEISDNVDLIEEIRKKHNSYFVLSSHPNLDGYAFRLQSPQFHREGKDLRTILQEALNLTAAHNYL